MSRKLILLLFVSYIFFLFSLYILIPQPTSASSSLYVRGVSNGVVVKQSTVAFSKITPLPTLSPTPVSIRKVVSLPSPFAKTVVTLEKSATPTPTITPSNSPTPTPTKIILTSTPTPIKTTSASISTPTPTPTKKPDPTPTSVVQTTQPTGDVQTFIMNEINNYRKSQGLSTVSTDSNTCSFARTRAEEISKNFNHDGFSNRIKSKTLPYPSYTKVTENIAMNNDYKEVVKWWINSAPHAENMRADTPFVCVEQVGNYYAYEGWKQ